MKGLYFFLVIIFSLLIVESIDAQSRRYRIKQRFHAGFALGANMAQIDGDDFQGYRKLGLQAGLEAQAILTRKSFLSFELLFSQRGSRSKENNTRSFINNHANIRLTYAEVPILFNLQVNKNENDFYQVNLQMGFSYARLLNTDIETNFSTVSSIESPIRDLEQLEPDFRNNDISMILGVQRNISKNLGLFIRHTLSLTPFLTIYNAPPAGAKRNLRSYYISFGAHYIVK